MIYVIRHEGSGHIKVGWAISPDKRLRSLQTANSEPLRLLEQFPGSREREREIHRRLKDLRISGEWFAPEAEVLRRVGEFREVLYETQEGRAYVVLRRYSEASRTDYCPFCGHRHTHGIGDGHRTPHCSKVLRAEVAAGDSTVLRHEDGYLIRTDPLFRMSP